MRLSLPRLLLATLLIAPTGCARCAGDLGNDAPSPETTTSATGLRGRPDRLKLVRPSRHGMALLDAAGVGASPADAAASD